MQLFHVTSSLNRDSILVHGLDWRRMGAARGIAGSEVAEQQGCFVCLSDHELEWFVSMNNTGGTVDVWAVEGIEIEALVESPEGYLYLPGTIPTERLTLVRTDLPPEDRWRDSASEGAVHDGRSGVFGYLDLGPHQGIVGGDDK